MERLIRSGCYLITRERIKMWRGIMMRGWIRSLFSKKISQGFAFIQMEYCSEGSLRQALERCAFQQDSVKAWEFVRGICNGLVHIHRSEIIHYDLKPVWLKMDNIFFSIVGKCRDSVSLHTENCGFRRQLSCGDKGTFGSAMH